MLRRQHKVNDQHHDMPLIYYMEGHNLHFGRREFSLITGFCFGTVSFELHSSGELKFWNRVFPNKIGFSITNLDIIGVIEDEEMFGKLSDDDAIRLCLLLALEVIFIGHLLTFNVDDTLFSLVENIKAWNSLPWGEHLWCHLYDEIKNLKEKHGDEHYYGLFKDCNYVPTYTLSGCVFAFQLEKSRKRGKTCFMVSSIGGTTDNIVRKKWLNDLVIMELNFCLFKLETIIQVLAHKRSDRQAKLKFTDEFSRSLTLIYYISALYDYLREEELRLCLEGEEKMRCEHQKLIVEENRIRLDEAKRLRLEEENMLQLEQQKKNKRKEFINSSHCKNLLSKLAPAKRIQLCSSSEKIKPKVSWVKIKKYRQQVYDPCTAEFLKNVKPWVEDTSRVLQSIDTVWLSDDIERFLGQSGQIKCKFPWNDDYIVDRNFWLKLVCLDPARKGWLTEEHIDLWVDYMWHVRPENSNWAMVSCYFVQLLLQKGMPLFYANGERYTTPWSEVDQVFIPINETGEHWCLAQFHIMSGEVTFYDTGHTYDYDYRDWDFQLVRDTYVSSQQLMVRCKERHEQILELQNLVGSTVVAESVRLLQKFQQDNLESSRGMMRLICETQLKVQLLVVLERAYIFQKNGIDPSKYTITFRLADNVPKQGGVYGDCGVWVCILLYRVVHGLSLDVDDPVDVALTYREKMDYCMHKVNDQHHDMPLIYYMEGHNLHFGRREFSLITGFRFGTDEEMFARHYLDDDAIRLCLLLALEVIFMGHLLTFNVDDTLFSLVENIKAWNSLPWGEHLWCHLYDEIKNLKEKHGDEHYYELFKDRNYVPTYTLSGFVFAFQLMVRCEERHEQILELQNLVGSTVVAESVRLLQKFQQDDFDSVMFYFVQLPVVLERVNIFQKNGIDPSKYTITLAHELSLDVDDPVDVDLAYREKMV
ncbi:phospholipase-like protein [Tanacetum coccineum]